MKHSKIFSLMALIMSVLGLASCSDDNGSNPVLDTAPTEFVLNTPALTEQYIQLSKDNTVNLKWSQPDYGFAAIATYKVQVGLVENGDIRWSDQFLESSYTVCSADVSGEELAQALSYLDGFKQLEDYVDKGYREVAVRIHSAIDDGNGNDVPVTEIYSNPVIFKHMAGYKTVRAKDFIYLVGACTGWTSPAESESEFYKSWRIYETEIGSKIYVGSFYINPDKFQFRFYTKLTGWEDDSYGSQEDDAPKDVAFDSKNVISSTAVKGKGSWKVDGFQGGYVTVTVDMNKGAVKFEYTGDSPAAGL